MRSAGVLAGVAIALGVVLPASATGATIEVRETFGQEAVTYIAANGEENNVTMSLVRDGGNWRVKVEDLAPQDLGAGCEAINTGVVCTTGERPRIDVDLGDEGDHFNGSELVDPDMGKYADPVVIDGGDGDDGITSISAYSCPDGEDGSDRIRLVDFQGSIAGHGSCVVFGGDGRDRIFGSDRADFIWAGPGLDRLEGNGASDELDGGAAGDTIRGGVGDDELIPGHGGDQVNGGDGDDELLVIYPPPAKEDGTDEFLGNAGNDSALYLCGGCTLRLDGKKNDGLPGEKDALDVEDVEIRSKEFNDEIGTNYGPGHDVLEGGAANEVLRTKRGDDKLIGGRGEDVLDSGNDDDSIRAADGERDEVDCGPGEDVASIDQFDDVKNCELTGEVIFDRRRRR